LAAVILDHAGLEEFIPHLDAGASKIRKHLNKTGFMSSIEFISG
jgi:hypothetical protein